MPNKFVRLTHVISSSRQPVAVNATLVMAVKQKGETELRGLFRRGEGDAHR